MIGLMKKLFGGFATVLSSPALAQQPQLIATEPNPTITNVPVNICPPNTFNPLCGLGAQNLGQIVSSVITIVFVIAVIIAVVFLIYGGIRWVLSGGDKSKVEEARNHVVAAIVGLIIAFVAFFFINFIIGFFLQDFILTNLKIPFLNLPNVSPTP